MPLDSKAKGPNLGPQPLQRMSEKKHHSERSSRRGSREHSRRKWGRFLERIGGTLICLLVAATPWMYGTTESWSIGIMNAGSYAAALIFLAAGIVSRRDSALIPDRRERAVKAAFLAVNLLLLLFVLTAWWNARASFSVNEQTFTYRDYIPWLPTTYDVNLTRSTFFTVLACFAGFWSLRRWLLTGWDRMHHSRTERPGATALGSPRFAAFLWVLAINGMLLAVQGILQRLGGSPRLLWMRMSYWGEFDSCFGPFSYNGNASEYLNLIWPVTLGAWWGLSRERQRAQAVPRVLTDGPELMLIPALLLTCTASFATSSRGGAIIAAALLLTIAGLLLVQKGVSKARRITGVAFVLAVFGLVAFLGWAHLIQRFRLDSIHDLSGRTEIYQNARQIADDFPVFGAGPGSFRSVYQLYRADANQPWHGFVHDDWLETRVTFGWTGFTLVVLQLILLATWIALPGKAPVSPVFVLCCGLGLAGCLGHAKFDFPFQTYSILYTFVMIAGVLTTITPRK